MESVSNKSLSGKKILVTGGGRGIGAGIVKSLARQGARVAFTYTSRPDAAAKVLSSLEGEGHKIFALNVTDPESVKSTVAQVLEDFGSLDGLVNNAGITRDQLTLRMKIEDFDEVIGTNLRGAFLLCKALLRPMIKSRGGSIVNISSVVGQMGNPGQANYCASKAGLEGMTRSLALEVASRGVRINAVAPGFIATDMSEALDAKQKEAIESRIPMGKMGDTDSVAAAVAFLLSDEADYITGHTLHVNGGLFM